MRLRPLSPLQRIREVLLLCWSRRRGSIDLDVVDPRGQDLATRSTDGAGGWCLYSLLPIRQLPDFVYRVLATGNENFVDGCIESGNGTG